MPPPSEIKAAGYTPEQLKTANFIRGQGCNYCHHTGYRGRKGIFEMMAMSGAHPRDDVQPRTDPTDPQKGPPNWHEDFVRRRPVEST